MPEEIKEETKEEAEEQTEEAAEEIVEEEAEEVAEEDTVPHGALHAERERRKASELRYRKLEEEIASQRTVLGQEGYVGSERDWEELGITPEAAAALMEDAAMMELVNRTAASRMLAEDKYPDYNEVMEQSGFQQKLDSDPALQAVIARKPLPAFAAYDIAQGLLGNFDEENVEEKIEEAKREGAREVIDKVTTKRPKDLTGVKSVGKDAGGVLTRAKVAKMNVDEYAKLPQEEKDRFLFCFFLDFFRHLPSPVAHFRYGHRSLV